MQEVPYQIKDRSIEHGVSLLNGLQTEGLYEMTLAQAWRAEPEYVFGLSYKAAGGQVEDLLPGQAGVERPVEVIKCLLVTELGDLDAAGNLPITSQQYFIL